MSIIDVIRNKDLVEYIQGKYKEDNLELQPDNTYRSVCSLHTGATNPTSFTVFPNNKYYCFSCGETGDIISYIMEREGLNFHQAVLMLCDEYGLTLDDKYKTQMTLTEQNEKWLKQYERNLNKCHDYLVQKRGLTDETIRKFRIGWSDNSSTVVIPMFNQYGQCISFLYRFFDKLPKYKNSKNSEIFCKGEYLYNIDKVSKRIKDNKRLYVCEGAFDVMSLDQMNEAGLAYCGISFTKSHVLLIKELTERIKGVQIILVPDNDNKACKWVGRGRDLFNQHYPSANVHVAVIE